MPTRVRYEETQCRSALNRVQGMQFRWSLNPYRGCVHGCHYCFARRYHSYYDLNVGDDFTSVIIVKTNVARVLRKELSRPSWRREPVAVGTATDPYQPIEGKYRLTRQCLEAFADCRSPVRMVTKGSMIIRDIDVSVRPDPPCRGHGLLQPDHHGQGPCETLGAGHASPCQTYACAGATGPGGNQRRRALVPHNTRHHRQPGKPSGGGSSRILQRGTVPQRAGAPPQGRHPRPLPRLHEGRVPSPAPRISAPLS